MDEHGARDSSNSPSSGAQTPMHASGSSGAHPVMQPPAAQGQYRSHMGQQALRSRHSSFNLSQHASNSPTSSGAPSPPLDSSTRPSQMPRSKVSSGPVAKRPSTADSNKNREDITPWEFDQAIQPINTQSQDTRPHHVQPRSAPSVRSRTSSIPLASMPSTGTVEDVTPWEMHPAPSEDLQGSGRDAALRPRANTSASNSSSTHSGGGGIGYGISIEKDFGPDKARIVAPTSAAMSLRSRASSAALAVGPLEDVTPWEIQELAIEEEGRDTVPSPLLSPALSLPYSQPRAANASARSRASSIAQRGTGTGTVAEVTPWEVQALLLEEDEEGMSDVEEEPAQHRTSVDDRSSVVSGASKSSRSGISGRFSRKSERRSGEVERISESGFKMGSSERRKSFVSGSSANIRASIEFGIKGGLGYGVPIEKHYGTPNIGPSGTAANGQGGLEQMKNVTPWELYPVPPVPPIPSDLQQPFESPDQETVTKRAKSRNIASKAMLTLKGRGGNKSAEKDAQKKQASRISTASNGSQGLSSSSLQVANPNSPHAASAAASTSTLGSYSSQPSNGNLPYSQSSHVSGSSQHSLPQPQRPVMTGTVEDVLPWEMHDEIPPVPPLPSLVVSDSTSTKTKTSTSSSEMRTPMPSYGQSQFALAQSRTAATQVEFQTLSASVKLELGSSTTTTPRSTSRVQTPMLSLPLPVGPLVEVDSWDREGPTAVAHSDHSHDQRDPVGEHDTNRIESPLDAHNPRIGSSPPSPIATEAGAAVGRKASLPVLKRSPPAPQHIPSPTQSFAPIGAPSIAQSISSGTTATGTSASASVMSAGTGTSAKHRGSMTTEELAEVMPWELQPGPGAPETIPEVEGDGAGSAGVSRNPTSGDAPRQTMDMQPVQSDLPHTGVPAPGPIRQSVSAGVAKSIGLTDIRRRRSTGASGAAAAASLSRKTGKHVSKEKARASVVNGEIPTSSPLDTEPPHEDDEGHQFSTADRTILEQLKAAIKAKDAQFVLKGVGQTVLGGGKGSGKKHHPFPPSEVRYPRSYDREIVDLDVWETMVTQQLADSVTWHVFEAPPAKVLDIGCGTGTWILQCASKWKESCFTGLDVVPLHPNVRNFDSEELSLSSRVTWIQHNCLEGLPFQSEEFDFVHIKRIALGIPENKWDTFLEEIARVMKPGGALEVIEEDLFFPGTRHVEDDDNGLLVAASNLSSIADPLQSGQVPVDSEFTATPRVGHVNLPPMELSNPPVSGASGLGSDMTAGSFSPPLSAGIAPQSASSSKSANQAVTHHNTEEVDPFSELFGTSSVMVMGSMAIATQNDSFTELFKRHHQQAKDDNALGPAKNDSIQKQSPFLLRSLTRSPVNPRDHSILAAVWQGMLESRFINMTPLSLLENYLGYHFKDIRTHAPLFYTFPHVIRKPTAVEGSKLKSPPETPQQSSSNLSDDHDHSDSSDDDEARDAIIPRPRMSKPSVSRPPSSLSSYPGMASLTDARRPSLSANEPSTIQFPSRSGPTTQDVAQNKKSRAESDAKFSKLPNGAMNVDAKTLNIHLTLRAKEILACSESMWEYVEACQDGSQSGHSRKFASGIDADDSDDVSSSKNLIMDMSREDFDILLNHFEMDMLDKAGIGQALEAQHSWGTFSSATPLDDRNAFDKACAKYDQWVANQQSTSSIDGHDDNSSLSLSPTGIVLPAPKNSISTLDTSSDDASWRFSTPPTSHQSHTEAIPLPTTYTDIAPEKLLSRVLRVYVAWKAPQ